MAPFSSNRGSVSDSHLVQALDELFAGLDLLDEAPNELLSSLISASAVSDTFRFEKAQKRFSRAGELLALVLTKASADLPTNGIRFASMVGEFIVELETPKKRCLNVYNTQGSDQGDRAYHMYDTYLTAIGNLRSLVKGINSNQFDPKWIPGTEVVDIRPIPELPVINRKTGK